MERLILEAIVKELKELESVKQDSFFSEELKNIEFTTAKKAFKIAVVGEFSTGKSTFINAMIGRDLLSHATQEVTATITNIHNVGKVDKRYKTCDVTFYNGSVIHLQDDKKLIEYTTTQSSEHNVVQDIQYVDYYTDFMKDDTDIVIVDTPGLNGMADGHRELTLEEVKQANYCIYLFGIRGMADTDKIMIQQLSHYQNKFIFILNFIDQLKISEEEDVQDILNGIRNFLDEDVFQNHEDKEYEIFGVSSLKALASKDKEIKRLYQNDAQDICEEERQVLYEDSNFNQFENYLVKAINNTTIENLRLEQMKYLLEHFLKELEEQLTQSQEQIEFLRSEAGKKEGVERLEKKLQYFEESAEKNKEKVVTYAISECINIKREFTDYLRENLEKMKRKNIDSLQHFKRYEDLEYFVKSGELNGKIKVQADEIYDYIEESIGICLNGVLNNILMRIQEYMKDSHMNKNGEKITFTIGKIESRQEASLRSMERGIADTEQKKSQAERKVSAAAQEIRNGEYELSNTRDSHSRDMRMLNDAEKKKQDRLNRLGARPDVKRDYYYTTEYYTEEVYRGGWGILDSLFGPKHVKKSRQIPHETVDDSQRRAWEQQRNRIIDDSNGEISQYKSRVDADQNRLNSLKLQLERQKKNQQQAQNDYDYYKEKLVRDKSLLEDLRKKANMELLDALKKNIQRQIEVYCDDSEGEIAKIVQKYIKDVIGINQEIIVEKTKKFYDDRFSQLHQMYQSEIEGHKENVASRYRDYSEQLTKIGQMRRKLEHVS